MKKKFRNKTSLFVIIVFLLQLVNISTMHVNAVQDNFTISNVLGNYSRIPVENSWHTGVIELSGSTLQWRNTAGVTWPLIPDLVNNKLLTTSQCPYYSVPGGDAFILKTKTNNTGSLVVEGFTFYNEFFSIVKVSYEIKSTFASYETCNAKIDGPFIAWWDKNTNYEQDATRILAGLNAVRNETKSKFNMQDPKNITQGIYYNVYLHDGKGVFAQYGWGTGQSTDSNGFPFLTLGVNTSTDIYNHEGFHIFQYNSNSPGYRYGGDSMWYIEATANWYSAYKEPQIVDSYIEASAITAVPFLPFWYSAYSQPGELFNWQRACIQYGMHIFLIYLQQAGIITDNDIASGFYNGITMLPQEYLVSKAGLSNFEKIYADWAAHNTGGLDYLPMGSEARAEIELQNYGDKNDFNKYIATYNNEGTNGWVKPSDEFVTRSWGYNVYKINNSSTSTYTFSLKGSAQGQAGTASKFQSRVVVKNAGKSTYYNVDMMNAQTGSLTVNINSSDSEVYLIVAATPNKFEGKEKFPYEVKIDKSIPSLEGYTYCANENMSYTLNAYSDVAYGSYDPNLANKGFTFKKNQKGTITFNNQTFGDPNPGVVKKGYYNILQPVTITASSNSPTGESYEVYANNVKGATSVQFQTWTKAKGKDDLKSHKGIYDQVNNRWKITIKKSEHKNEIGQYITHVYAYDANGKRKMIGQIAVNVKQKQ